MSFPHNLRVLKAPLLTAVALTCAATRVIDAQAGQSPEAERQIARGKQLVVKIHPDEPGHGGGIIVAASADSIYIITALHVLSDAGLPDTVLVWFLFDSSTAVTAHVNKSVEPVTDSSLSDMALLSVARRAVPRFETAGLEFDRLGNPNRLQTGDRVISIGCPGDKCWDAEPDERVVGVGTRIAIYSQFIRPGKSGGALLNEWGEVTGMIIREESVLPFGGAINIDPALKQVRIWLKKRDPEVILHRPTYPRAGYGLTLGALFLTEPQNSGDGRAPSGHVDIEGHLQRALDWRLGVVRLAPDNLAITAMTAGLAIPLRAGRLTTTAYVDGAMGRGEAQHDLGGYSTATSGVTTYKPNWATTVGAGFGGEFGVSMTLLVLKRTFVEITAARWAFQTPVDSPPIPDLFLGGGVRWAIR